jgi:hypothetical protein
MPESSLVLVRAAAWRRPVGMQLTKWQVTPKNGQSGFAERRRQRNEQCRLAVRPGPVREDQRIAGRICWNVEKSTDARCPEVMRKREYAGLAHLT